MSSSSSMEGLLMLSPAERMDFWTGIMRDHAEFLLMSLSSRETEPVRMAQYFKSIFLDLNAEAKALINTKDGLASANLAKKTEPVLIKFIEFKKLILRRLLQCNIEIGFPPSFINHLINEAMEFMRDLNAIQLEPSNLNPVEEMIQLHKIWLPDAAGHAASIASDLDPVEFNYIMEAEEFKKTFNHLFLKANELGIMLERTGHANGALMWFNMEVEIRLSTFICFLEKIRELRETCRILGTINPLIPDHMIREEKFFIANIQDYGR